MIQKASSVVLSDQATPIPQEHMRTTHHSLLGSSVPTLRPRHLGCSAGHTTLHMWKDTFLLPAASHPHTSTFSHAKATPACEQKHEAKGKRTEGNAAFHTHRSAAPPSPTSEAFKKSQLRANTVFCIKDCVSGCSAPQTHGLSDGLLRRDTAPVTKCCTPSPQPGHKGRRSSLPG